MIKNVYLLIYENIGKPRGKTERYGKPSHFWISKKIINLINCIFTIFRASRKKCKLYLLSSFKKLIEYWFEKTSVDVLLIILFRGFNII